MSKHHAFKKAETCSWFKIIVFKLFAPWAEKVPEERRTECIGKTGSACSLSSRADPEIPPFDPFYMLYLSIRHGITLGGYLVY